MAQNRNVSGCHPIGPPQGNVFQPITAMVYELTQLDPEVYRGVIVTLKFALGPGRVSGPLEYRVPMTHSLAIERIEPHFAFLDYANEVVDFTNSEDDTKGLGSYATNPSVMDRMHLKAMNCVVSLDNSDRSQPVMENGPATLFSLMQHPTDWTNKPHIVPAGELLRGQVLLQNQSVAMVGGLTEYGLVIKGSLVRTRAS